MSYGEPLADPALQKQIFNGVYIPCMNDFAAGCLGGCAGLVFGHPFDTVKVRQHTYTGPKITIAQCARQTLNNEGSVLTAQQGVLTAQQGVLTTQQGISVS
ncbi:hypothetical protein LSAT2_018938 [Lamellibrachia satsuma]|nr:hypothetical protein LSAT2_018938 [Lamellibrachia satsuma]